MPRSIRKGFFSIFRTEFGLLTSGVLVFGRLVFEGLVVGILAALPAQAEPPLPGCIPLEAPIAIDGDTVAGRALLLPGQRWWCGFAASMRRR